MFTIKATEIGIERGVKDVSEKYDDGFSHKEPTNEFKVILKLDGGIEEANEVMNALQTGDKEFKVEVTE